MTRSEAWTELAKAEFAHFVRGYEDKQANLGVRFALTVGTTVRNILSNPLAFAIINRRGTRLARVRKFPFGILFRRTRTHVLITGVINLRSHPIRWMQRG